MWHVWHTGEAAHRLHQRLWWFWSKEWVSRVQCTIIVSHSIRLLFKFQTYIIRSTNHIEYPYCTFDRQYLSQQQLCNVSLVWEPNLSTSQEPRGTHTKRTPKWHAQDTLALIREPHCWKSHYVFHKQFLTVSEANCWSSHFFTNNFSQEWVKRTVEARTIREQRDKTIMSTIPRRTAPLGLGPKRATAPVLRSMHSELEQLTCPFVSWYDILVHEHLFVLHEGTLCYE